MTRSLAPVLVALALIGFAIAAYLTAYQLGIVASVWDPLFGRGSEEVLTSPIARLLPIPDASLGAVVYAVDAVLAIAIGLRFGPGRGLRLALAVLAIAGALAGLGLVALQALVVGAWCSLCLASAAISILLAAGAVAEARHAGEEARGTVAEAARAADARGSDHSPSNRYQEAHR